MWVKAIYVGLSDIGSSDPRSATLEYHVADL